MTRSFLGAAAAILFCCARLGAQEVDARGVMVMNMKSGSILYVQNENARIAPASLTKIMTMYVLMDMLEQGELRLDDRVRISRAAAETKGSSMGLKAGEVVPLERLIAGISIASGNDASVAAAEFACGSVKKFVAKMNAKARQLGLKDTKFTNPHGLPPAAGQYTTARDMLYLTKSYIETHPKALRYHNTPKITHGKTTTTNKNGLLGTMEGVDGVKTGWIQASGHNLISTCKRGDVRIICSLLGSSSSKAETEESRFLIEAAFKTVASGGSYKISQQLAERETPPPSDKSASAEGAPAKKNRS